MEQRRQNLTAVFDGAALAVSERASSRSLLVPLTEARANIRQRGDSSPIMRERSLRQRLNATAAAQVSLLKRLLIVAGVALQYILYGAPASPAGNPRSAIHNPQSTSLLSADSRARNRPSDFGFSAGGVDDERASALPATLPQGYEIGDERYTLTTWAVSTHLNEAIAEALILYIRQKEKDS